MLTIDLLCIIYFTLKQCTSTKISKNKKKKMKKKLKKQIEKQQQQQDEIEQGILEENEEDSDKETEDCSNNTENCTENTTECEQKTSEQAPSEELSNCSQEKTVENHVDTESVELSEELSSQTLQEMGETASNDAMSTTEEQLEPGGFFCFLTNINK